MNKRVIKLSEMFELDPFETQVFIDFYNYHYDKYGNDIYRHIESRITHWINFHNGGWFQNRIHLALDHLENLVKKYDHVILVDMGFSVPYVYSRKKLRELNNLTCVFIDKYNSAGLFWKELKKKFKDNEKRNKDIFVCADIERDEKLILKSVREIPGSENAKIVIVASEILEHLSSTDSCWQTMYKLSNISGNSSAYITLPVGKAIPSHTLEFKNENDAKNYVLQYASVVDDILLSPPENESASKYLEKCYCAYIDIYSQKR